MANKQAWRDFAIIIGRIETLVNDIIQMNNNVDRLLKDKQDILDDSVRKNELKKILDVHPDYSFSWIVSKITKLEELKNHLKDNNYL